MPALPSRIVIYPKDIEILTGRRPRTAQEILRRIKKHYNKRKFDLVTVQEFCEFMKMKEEFVREFLGEG